MKKDNINLPSGKKLFFASDFHLGIPNTEESLVREKKLVSWLDQIKNEAFEIYLMGDVFDFWFEYKTVIPKGFVRLLGKLAEITDSGVPVHLFRGNHDVWAFDYLKKEVGIQLHRNPQVRIYNDKSFYLAHGDGLGPGDHGYKLLKKVFACPFCQWLFRWLHPDWGARMGLYFSQKSRLANIAKEGRKDNRDQSIEEEMLYQYAKHMINNGFEYDFFIFGHRHLPVKNQISKRSNLIILGDWITNYTYAEFSGDTIKLREYQNR